MSALKWKSWNGNGAKPRRSRTSLTEPSVQPTPSKKSFAGLNDPTKGLNRPVENCPTTASEPLVSSTLYGRAPHKDRRLAYPQEADLAEGQGARRSQLPRAQADDAP